MKICRRAPERTQPRIVRYRSLQALFRPAALLLVACLLIGAAAGSCSRRRSQPTPGFPALSLVPVATGFNRPLGIANAGDGSDRLFIVEQGGLVRIVRNGSVLPTPFLDVSSLLGSSTGEQGLLGIAFPPGYGPARPFVYTNYTGTGGTAGDTVIASFQTSSSPDQSDLASRKVLLTAGQPFANHNGGQFAFGPDGYLYIGLGDGGSAGDPQNNAQNPRSLLGKMLRIDVGPAGSYTVPPDNPFAGDPSYRPEIWALGLRNPWRFSFDRGTGDLFIADVGQNQIEEIDRQPAGRGGGNYGWNILEGSQCYRSATCATAGLTMPVTEYRHGQGDCSITGGYVYRGQLYPDLQGLYLYGDYCSGRIWGLRITAAGAESGLLLESGLRISSFGEDEAGGIYVADHANGVIYRIVVP